MGLVALWTTIAGPRVKEITPQCQTPWLDRGRPTTSSGVRFGKKRPGSTGDDLDKRPTTSSGDKKFKRMGRSLSRPRKSLPLDTDIPPTPPAVEVTVDDIVPDIPAIPSGYSQEHTNTKEASVHEESPEKSSIAVTSEGLNDMHIFELPAEPISTPSSVCLENPLIRPRSKSPSRQTSPTKVGNAFTIGGGTNKVLPPPPPPSGPLPPIPSEPPPMPPSASPTSPRRKNSDYSGHTLRRSQSSGSRSESRPHFVRSSSENDFGKFPAVPSLLHDTDTTPESSIPNSEVSSICSPTYERHLFTAPTRRLPASIDVNTARNHQYKDSGIGTPKTPLTPGGSRRWPHATADEELDEAIDVTGWSEADLKEWDKSLGQFRESILKDDRYGGAGLMRSLEAHADKLRNTNTSSNKQALAELHFDV